MSIFFIIIASFISLSMMGLGYTAYVKNKQSDTNRLFFIFSLTLAIWCACNFLENWFVAPELAIIFLNLDFFFGPLVFFWTLLFLLNFPEPNTKLTSRAAWLIFPTVLVSALSLAGKIITNIYFTDGRIGFELGPWFILYAIIIMAYMIAAIVFQIKQYRGSTGMRKMQIRYMISGFVISSSIILIFNLFLQNIISGDAFRIGNFSLIILIGFIYYSIVRYHLMNIGVILRLGAIYTLLLTTITFIYVLGSYFLISFFKIGQPWNYIIPSIIVTVGFMPLKNVLELLTDKVFFKKQYRFSEVASKIESSIHEAGLDLDKTLEIISQVISDALKVKSSAILILIPRGHFISRQVIGENSTNLKLRQDSPIVNCLNLNQNKILDKEELERQIYSNKSADPSLGEVVKELDKNNFSLVVPIELKGKLIGVYLLGPKKSQDPFSKEDTRLLRHVAWEMGFAIDNAKSYEELKKLDEVKSSFISVVSHQLRTPVTVSRCNLELCFDASISRKEKNEAIKAAYEGTISLGRQLDQLITVLEIEEKNVTLRKKIVKINTLIDEVVAENKIHFKNKNIILDVESRKTALMANCDEEKIKKVLDIILVNAISYVLSSGHIWISLKKESFNKKDKVLIAITDNGIGILEESKGEMFKKFFRSPEAIAISPNGFGLGLFIAKKIMDAHGGDIWFENKDDRGVTFFVTIPIK